jgi:hypothetical protein
MLGRTLHIENSCFRLLPNPTMYRWDRKTFSINKLLDAYEEQMDHHIIESRTSPILVRIKEHIDKIQAETRKQADTYRLSKRDNFGWLGLPLMNCLHSALDDMDEVLTAKEKPRKEFSFGKDQRSTTHRTTLTTKTTDTQRIELAVIDPKKEQETLREIERRRKVQDVLRSHVQSVLRMINEKGFDDDSRSVSPTSLRISTLPAPPSFEDIDDAAPEEKQSKFMEVYFKVVRKRVIGQAVTSSKRRESIAAGTGMTPTIGIKRAPTEKSIPEQQEEAVDPAAKLIPNPAEASSASTKEESELSEGLWDLDDILHEEIWCVLVFRMICWLMLHDFNKKDVQVSKSELLGSRLPVYIA